MAAVLLPLPRRDFDPTEVAVSWKVLTARGHRVAFATPNGRAAAADELMLSGAGLDPWGFLPGIKHLKIIGLILRANRAARCAYGEMLQAAAFREPLSWQALAADTFDGLLLCGGHRARGMREFLESEPLRSLTARFFAGNRPVAAICHGVLLAARSLNAQGKSVLYGRRTTALTWRQERAASVLAHIGRPWDRHYYRTYLEQRGEPRGFNSVQGEVTRTLAHPSDFLDVPRECEHHWRKTSGLFRDTPDDARPAFVLRDGNYVSARWPGDAHTFAATFAEVLGG